MPIKIRTTRNKARGHKVPQLAASTKDQSSRTAGAAAAALVRWMSFRTIFGAAPLHTLLPAKIQSTAHYPPREVQVMALKCLAFLLLLLRSNL